MSLWMHFLEADVVKCCHLKLGRLSLQSFPQTQFKITECCYIDTQTDDLKKFFEQLY